MRKRVWLSRPQHAHRRLSRFRRIGNVFLQFAHRLKQSGPAFCPCFRSLRFEAFLADMGGVVFTGEPFVNQR